MNRSIILAASAARTVSEVFESDALGLHANHNEDSRGVIVTIKVTAAASASITPTIQGYDRASDSWYTILVGTAIASVSTTHLRVHPDLTAASNLIAKDVLPFRWRLSIVAGNANPITYSIGANLVQ
jgi:hypothetical protein